MGMGFLFGASALAAACMPEGGEAATPSDASTAERPAPLPEGAKADRHRLLVLTDIEADPDDTQSLVRLLLYANEIDIEGLVATTSVHRKSDIRPGSIRTVIEKYGQVYPTLRQHAPGYPSEDDLLDRVMEGQPGYGMASIGAGQETEGSNAIIDALEADDERPLWVSVWGGVNTLAQALLTIRETRDEGEAARLISKLRVYTIADQDDAGIWIRTAFPDLFYIVSPGPYDGATWTAITRPSAPFDSAATNDWIAENIQQGHGPLGAHYPDVVWGMEGDTPAFLSLIPTGLDMPDRPDAGGWGGRYALYTPSPEEIGVGEGNTVTGGVPLLPEPRPIWTDVDDTYQHWGPRPGGRAIGPVGQTYTNNAMTILRWKNDFQNDFAARMDWTVRDYEDANHPPVVRLSHDERLTATEGQYVTLDATGSFDPDGDSLSYHWFNYPEAGTLDEPVDLGHAVNTARVGTRMPAVESRQAAHFIVRVTDKGEPALSRYGRVIVTIEPD